MAFCICFLFLIACVLIYFEVKRIILSYRFKHIPSYREIPIIGTSLVLEKNFLSGEFVKVFNDISHHSLTKLFLGPKLIFLVSDPETVKNILLGTNFVEKSFAKFYRAPFNVVMAKCKSKFESILIEF